MRAGQPKMPECSSVGAKFVGRQQFRHKALFPEQLAHQPECRALVAAALNQHVENFALVIDGAPQVHPLARDANDHFVEMPPVARAWAGVSEPARKTGPELQNPAPHRLIGNLQASLGQELLNVAVAQCESEIEPNCVLDHRRREAVPAIRRADPCRKPTPPGGSPELRFRDNANARYAFCSSIFFVGRSSTRSPRGSCTACERGGGGADHDLRFLRGLWHFCLGKFLNASSSST